MLKEVFHITEREFVDSIQDGGLKTLAQQGREKTIDLEEIIAIRGRKSMRDAELMKFYINTLYFRLEEPPLEVSRVSIQVNEQVEDVVNNRLEFQTFETYMSSRMKLSRFLDASRGEKMLHPVLATPITADQLKPVGDISEHRLYSPEVIIQRACIRDIVSVNVGSQ